MEMEQKTPLMAKKLCRIIRLILYMVKKRLLKTIPWFELHMLLKRTTKVAGKGIGNLLLEHQTLSSALTCRPNDIHTTFISPIAYEFSCPDTPLFYTKRKNNRHYSCSAGNGGLYRRSHKNGHELTVSHVRKVFDSLNGYETVEPEKSPLTLLGIGESGIVRQLRVTDSPFPEKNTEEEEDTLQVDKAADEFIKKFYKDLKQQKKRAAVEPASPALVYRKWGEVR